MELILEENTITDKMNELQAMGKTFNQVIFLKKAVQVLYESRRQLMFTYIFAYYVKSNNQKSLFEANQSDLESATEALSQYFEQDLTKDNADEIMHKVIDKSRCIFIPHFHFGIHAFSIQIHKNVLFSFAAIVNAARKRCKNIFTKDLKTTGGLFHHIFDQATTFCNEHSQDLLSMCSFKGLA